MSVGLAYPGARPFRREDSGRFFGREDEIAELSTLWLHHPLTFVSGPAGIGKSSLIAAGVLPEVNKADVELLPVGLISGGSSSPISPPGQPTPYTLSLLRSWAQDRTSLLLDPFTVDEFVASRVRHRDPSVVMLAAIDQAEDVFAGPPSRQSQRQRFLFELSDALRQHPSLHLLICVRDEALPRFIEALGVGAHLPLKALKPEQAWMAVTRPGGFETRAAADLIEAIRASDIIDDSGTKRQVLVDSVEPALLQIACSRLWGATTGRSRVITRRELRRRRIDIDHALSAHCAKAISVVADAHGIPADSLRLWLVDTFVAASGSCQDEDEGPAATAGQPNTVPRALEDRHIVRARAGRSAGSRIYRLIADRIIEPIRHAADGQQPEVDPGEYLRAAEHALAVGDDDLAARYAELARLSAPDTDLVLHGNALSLLGNIALGRKQLRLAVDHYGDALKLFEVAMEHSMVPLLLAAIGRTLIKSGDLLEGINSLRAAVLRMPADTIIQTEFSAAAQELGWHLPLTDPKPRVSPA